MTNWDGAKNKIWNVSRSVGTFWMRPTGMFYRNECAPDLRTSIREMRNDFCKWMKNIQPPQCSMSSVQTHLQEGMCSTNASKLVLAYPVWNAYAYRVLCKNMRGLIIVTLRNGKDLIWEHCYATPMEKNMLWTIQHSWQSGEGQKHTLAPSSIILTQENKERYDKYRLDTTIALEIT